MQNISLDNLYSVVCRTLQTWRLTWITCARAPHWLSALRGSMLWRDCLMCSAKRTHPCGQPVMAWLIHTMASMVSALYYMLVHIHEYATVLTQINLPCITLLYVWNNGNQCYRIRFKSESNSGCEDAFSRGALLYWDEHNETGAGTRHSQDLVLGLCIWLINGRHSVFILGFLLQIFNMCSDPLASVEREQSCTLAPVGQEGLSPLMASAPNGSLDH